MKTFKPRSTQFFQDKANNTLNGDSQPKMAPVQKMDAKDEEHLQMKQHPAQLMESPEEEEEQLQMKKGPLQMMESGEQEEEELQMKKSPLQMMESPEEEEEQVQMKKGPLQMMESVEQEEEELQMKENPAQLMESPEEEEEQVQMKKGPLQMMESGEQEEEELQMKVDSEPSSASKGPVQEGAGNPMPDGVRSKMEAAFKADFSGVKIHEGEKAASMGALAYAQGEEIHFAPGKYSPNSTGGQELLGHELAHVVQQREGRVKATKQAKGGAVINDDLSLEKEADELGSLAARSTELEKEEETEEAASSLPEYYVSAFGASIRQDAEPHKATNKLIPVGERVSLVSTDTKKTLGKVKLQSTGEEVWTAMSNMTEVKLEIENQMYRVPKDGTKIYSSPFVTKGTSVALTQTQYLKIRESCGKFVKVEVSPTQFGWIKKEELLFKPKDTADNFASFSETTDWTELSEVDEETYKKIEANRNAINDRTDAQTYGKGAGNVLSKSGKGYMYTGKNLYDAPVTGTSEKDTEVKTSINNELKREGGYSSINTWDGQVFTYGRGFATGGSLVKLLKIILAKDPKYKNIFLQVGIGIKGNDIVVIGSDRKVTANDESKKAYEASKLIRSDARLQSFFMELGEKKDYGQDVADAQVQLLQTSGAFNYPSYVIDKDTNSYKDNWNATSVRLMAHLKHWAPGGANWNTTDYSDTKGDLMQVIYKYITETAKKSVFVKATHSNNVIEWSTSLLVLSKLKEFSEPQGVGYDTFVATYNDDYYKDLEIKDKKVYLKGEKKVLSNAIIIKDGGKYRIVVPIGNKLAAHLTEEK